MPEPLDISSHIFPVPSPPKFDEDATIGTTQTALRCAHCDESYGLHRTETIHFLRDDEDTESGLLVVTSSWSSVNKNINNMAGNPSARRSGLLMRFFCEACSQHSELTFAQHKGATYVEMKAMDKDPWPDCD